MGGSYSIPDLAIAFNSGASEYVTGWKETAAFLVANKIPSVFTVRWSDSVIVQHADVDAGLHR